MNTNITAFYTNSNEVLISPHPVGYLKCWLSLPKNEISIILKDRKSIKKTQENSKTIHQTVAAVDKQSLWGVYCVWKRGLISISKPLYTRIKVKLSTFIKIGWLLNTAPIQYIRAQSLAVDTAYL